MLRETTASCPCAETHAQDIPPGSIRAERSVLIEPVCLRGVVSAVQAHRDGPLFSHLPHWRCSSSITRRKPALLMPPEPVRAFLEKFPWILTIIEIQDISRRLVCSLNLPDLFLKRARTSADHRRKFR